MIELSKQDLETGGLSLGTRPAIIAVDFSNGFTSLNNPLGGNFDKEIEACVSLMRVAKEQNVPIYFTTVVYHNEGQASVFRKRLPALNTLAAGSRWVDIHPKFDSFVTPDNLIEKQYPSAFFNTNLQDKLIADKADTLLITGLTTSGCVRATCLDGLQHNYVCNVVEDACGDRNKDAHKMNLHDLHAKYAEVGSLQQAIEYLQQLKH